LWNSCTSFVRFFSLNVLGPFSRAYSFIHPSYIGIVFDQFLEEVMSFTNNAFSTLQRVGKSLMMPVSVLPAAGLLVALGRIVQDATVTNGEVTNVIINAIGKFMFSGGLAIFEQLPVVFAIGVAIGFTGGAGVAGLAAVVGYFTMANVLKVFGEVRGLELAINTGVFGGIFMGLISASLYSRFHKTKLPQILGFFSGKRLVPIVTAGTAIFAGLLLGFIWPPIQEAINDFGKMVMDSQFGPAFYAAGKRLLIPVGLHHVYYPPFLFEFGEFVTETGKVLQGESARYFAGDATAGRFMASEFPIMLFGLPAAALAMYLRAPKAKRKAVGGIMLSAALTSIITGITEPIEFAFIFVAPLLYVFHVIAAFGSGFLTGYFDIHLGYTFSASVIDYVVGFFNQKSSMYLWTVVGPIMFATYFSFFYWAIEFFDFKTPGRDATDSDEDSEMNVVPASQKAILILEAIGDSANIKHLDACITRLRLSVNNPEKVNQARLKQLGAAGVMVSGDNFQVIFGVESDMLKEEIKAIVESGGTAKAALKNAPQNAPKVEETKVATKADVNAEPGKTIYFRSPLNGELVSIENVPDATFSDKLLGDGVAIIPSEGVIYSPVDGKITQLFRTNHAIGITTPEGGEILVHIGLDTVKLNGQGFKALINTGDTVKAGDKLIEFDLKYIRDNAKSDITPCVITNMAQVKNFQMIAKQGKIEANQELFNFSIQ
jgi:glucose PTS system EIICBA or EIICB component